MQNEKLIEMKNRLAMLPGLQDRLDRLRGRMYEAEAEVKDLLEKLEEETQDVEQLKKESFSVTLLKLVKKYEGKLDKESQEAIAAKMEYDKATERAKAFNSEYNELGSRVTELKREKDQYVTELFAREEEIQKNTEGEVYIKYKQLEGERETLAHQLVEIEEAISAAGRVRGTAESAVQSLESAEDWATYDVWARGGILSHMAKYENIDDAEECFNRLSCQLKDLQIELMDVNVLDVPDLTVIDSTTRTFDFWFDNIFTDLNVRDNIRNNIQQMNKLDVQISSVIDKLEGKKVEVEGKMTELDRRKDDLIIAR